MSNVNNADGTYVVIENGQRVSQPTQIKEDAERAALERNRLAETSGKQTPESGQAKVKRNLMG